MNIFSITCPTTCEDAGTLGVLPEDICLLPPTRSEIFLLLMQGTGDGPTDMSDATKWVVSSVPLINNTDDTGVKFKYLIGSGSIADPEPVTLVGARNIEYVVEYKYALVFNVFDLSDPLIYEYVRQLQCGALKPKFMYADEGGFLYGKVKPTTTPDEGITPETVTATLPKDGGKDGRNRAVITFKWTAKTDPDRVTNPLTLGN